MEEELKENQKKIDKKELLWVILGIAGILIIWLVSRLIFK